MPRKAFIGSCKEPYFPDSLPAGAVESTESVEVDLVREERNDALGGSFEAKQVHPSVAGIRTGRGKSGPFCVSRTIDKCDK